MLRMRPLTVILSISACVTLLAANQPAAPAQEEARAQQRSERAEEAHELRHIVLSHANEWFGAEGEGATVSVQVLSSLLNDPHLEGEDAAAVAALFRHMRKEKQTETTVGELLSSKKIATTFAATRKIVRGGMNLYGPSGEPSTESIKQGYLGDCYFLSSVEAILNHDPHSIMRMIEPGPEPNLYAVKFPGYSKVVIVRMTPGLVAALPNSDINDGIWLPVLVMADSAVRNGGTAPLLPYEDMSGGRPTKCLHMLTGRAYTHVHLHTASPERVAAILTRAAERRTPVGCNTKGHDLCVLDYDPQARVVTVKNPWGTNGPYHFKNGVTVQMQDGCFQMPLHQFMQCFVGLTHPG